MIIGLIGLKQVGKTTAADYLVEKYGFVKHNFKDALVAEMKENFPDLLSAIRDSEQRGNLGHTVTVEELFQTKPPLMRALMQNYGTEVRRGDSDNYWIKKWRDTLPKDANVVVDDVRFINEGNMVTTNGGVIVHLTRPDVVPTDGHSSETEHLQIKPDYSIECAMGEHELLKAELDYVYADQT